MQRVLPKQPRRLVLRQSRYRECHGSHDASCARIVCAPARHVSQRRRPTAFTSRLFAHRRCERLHGTERQLAAERVCQSILASLHPRHEERVTTWRAAGNSHHAGRMASQVNPPWRWSRQLAAPVGIHIDLAEVDVRFVAQFCGQVAPTARCGLSWTGPRGAARCTLSSLRWRAAPVSRW